MGSWNKIYHLCNESPKVIFRNEEDCLIGISRLAACAYATMTEVWAYSFMSTHFHLIVRTGNITEFVKLLKINFGIWHNKKYISDIHINIGKRELFNAGEIKTAVNYVLKNPIHHEIADIAFKYPYSSSHLYFRDKIYTDEYYPGERQPKIYRKPSELKSRIYRKLFSKHRVPESFMIQNECMVAPESFVRIDIIERLYSNARDFMYHMNKPLKEELEMFEENGPGFNESKISLFGKLSDMQVCKIIDESLAPRTYTGITPEEKEQLSQLLRKRGVDKHQLERVL